MYRLRTVRAGVPVDAIFSEDELPEEEQAFLELNAELCEIWPNITEKKDPLDDAEDWAESREARALRTLVGLLSIT